MNEPEIPTTPEQFADAEREFAELGPDQLVGIGATPVSSEEEHPVAVVNGQIVSMPFFDPGDGLWGGVSLGDVVAYYPSNQRTYRVGIVYDLLTDATISVFVPARCRDGYNGCVEHVPYHAQRARGGACWAHRNEEWTLMGWIADELDAGVGGPDWEQKHTAAKES